MSQMASMAFAPQFKRKFEQLSAETQIVIFRECELAWEKACFGRRGVEEPFIKTLGRDFFYFLVGDYYVSFHLRETTLLFLDVDLTRNL